MSVLLEDGKYVPNYYTTTDFCANIFLYDRNDYADKIKIKNTFLTESVYPSIIGDINSFLTGNTNTSSYSGYTTNSSLLNTIRKNYDASYQELIDTKRKLITDRNQLDNKISFISSSRNVLNENDSSMLLNSTFYITILWTILATFLIYYIFMEL